MEIITIHEDVKTNIEAIEVCGQALLKKGYITQEFIADCLEREQDYPTGLESPICVAMPHGNCNFVKKSALCVLIPNQSIPFQRMDDNSQSVDAQAIFMLAISDSNQHLESMKRLLALFYDKNEMELLMSLTNEDLQTRLTALL